LSETRSNPELYVETINLLAVIRILGDEYRVPNDIIARMIKGMDRVPLDAELPGIDYFLVTALLFHMGDDSYYAQEKKDIVEKVLKLFKEVDILRTGTICENISPC
jgi:hypothetical protein